MDHLVAPDQVTAVLRFFTAVLVRCRRACKLRPRQALQHKDCVSIHSARSIVSHEWRGGYDSDHIGESHGWPRVTGLPGAGGGADR